jgi:hypothetical protein
MKNVSFILLIFLLLSCNNIKKDLEGGWIINQAYINNKPVIWDFYNNCIDLKKDKTCELPPINSFINRNQNECVGYWDVKEKDNSFYLVIKTNNVFFNRTFEVSEIIKVTDSVSFGNLMKMSLISDSIKLDCSKELY